MASEEFTIRIFTPTGLVKDDRTTLVNLPSSNGEIGVLPNHTRYTGVLGTGILEYTPSQSSQKERMVVSEGFCNFNDDTLVVLADDVFTANDPRKESLLSKRPELEKVVADSGSDSIEWQVAKRALEQIEALSRL